MGKQGSPLLVLLLLDSKGCLHFYWHSWAPGLCWHEHATRTLILIKTTLFPVKFTLLQKQLKEQDAAHPKNIRDVYQPNEGDVNSCITSLWVSCRLLWKWSFLEQGSGNHFICVTHKLVTEADFCCITKDGLLKFPTGIYCSELTAWKKKPKKQLLILVSWVAPQCDWEVSVATLSY